MTITNSSGTSSNYYGNSTTNRKPGSGYSNNPNSVNPNGVTSNPYGASDRNKNPYRNSAENDGAGLSSNQGKEDGDWFSSAAPATHIMNPYAPSNIHVNASSSAGTNPISPNSLENPKMNASNSMEILKSAIPSPSNVAFAGPMEQMGLAQPHSNGHTMGTNINTITPIPGMVDYENEPPLLEELGINLKDIQMKSLAVLLPMKYQHNMVDNDLAGPLAFVLLLGGELLLAAKMNFGYIYGISLFGCAGMTLVLNLLSPTDSVSMWTVLSVLGYSLLPVNMLAGLNAIYRLRHMGSVGLVLAAVTIGWCACSSTRLFEESCGLREQRFLVAYPISLFYSAFVILTIF